MKKTIVALLALSLVTVVAGGASASLIQYAGSLDGNNAMTASLSSNGRFDDPLSASFFSFSGNAGDVVSLRVTRLEMDLDPAMWLFEGMLDGAEGFDAIDFAAKGFLGFADDEIAVDRGPFGDPQFLNYVLPSSGMFTAIVGNFASGQDDGGDGRFEFLLECEGCGETPDVPRLAVSEPAFLSLLGIGLIGLWRARRRR